jgi:hypothetical protein
MEKEYNALDMILTGTQKENEKCMHELEKYGLSDPYR